MQAVHKKAHTCEHQTFPFLEKSAFFFEVCTRNNNQITKWMEDYLQ